MQIAPRIPPTPGHMNAELTRVLEQHGGLFWLEGPHSEPTLQLFKTIVSRFRRHVEYARLHLYSDRPRPVEFGFLSASELNAFAYAARTDEVTPFDFIGINVGVPFTLANVFGRMLAHPDIFPEIGNSQNESRLIHDLPYLSTNVFFSEQALISPKCHIRAVFASELTQIALDFLFFHELSHLRNGHLEFARDFLALTHWIEATALSNGNSNSMIRQALEMDADCGAVLLTLNSAFRIKYLLECPVESAPADILSAMHAAYGTPRLAVRAVNFAAYILFRLFDVNEWVASVQSNQSHPLPPLRNFFINSTMLEIFSTRSEYSYEAKDFLADNAQIIADAEVACGLIRGEPPDARGIYSVISNDGHLAYLDKFKASWRSIRPHLEIYKRGGNLPP